MLLLTNMQYALYPSRTIFVQYIHAIDKMRDALNQYASILLGDKDRELQHGYQCPAWLNVIIFSLMNTNTNTNTNTMRQHAVSMPWLVRCHLWNQLISCFWLCFLTRIANGLKMSMSMLYWLFSNGLQNIQIKEKCNTYIDILVITREYWDKVIGLKQTNSKECRCHRRSVH